MDPDPFYATGLIVCLILDLISTAAHSSLLNSNLARLLAQRDHMENQVNRTTALISKLPRTQASLNLFQSLLRFLIAGLALLLLVPRTTTQYSIAYSLVVLLLAAVIVFFLEWIVQLGVSRHPETWAIRLSPFVSIQQVLITPILALPFKFLHPSESTQESSVTETELISLVEVGQEEGVLEQEEQKMIVSIFRLGDTFAREIMVPRIDILALDVNTPIDQALDAFQQSGHSRVPIYQDSVDNILGLLYAKDLLHIWREGRQDASLEELLRPAYFIPEAKMVDELLAELQAKRIHMAIVVDEYGGVAGLVTLEDIVEEIVGEIRDEYDQAEELTYQAINEDEFMFQGRIDLDDFNDIMGTDLPNSEADTLGGLIYSRIGRVPTAGDHVKIEDLELTVEQVSGQRIRKVRAQRMAATSQNGDNKHYVEQ